MPKAELIGLEAPETAHGSLLFALAQGPRQIESYGLTVAVVITADSVALLEPAVIKPPQQDREKLPTSVPPA